jgi:hypothetical protein
LLYWKYQIFGLHKIKSSKGTVQLTTSIHWPCYCTLCVYAVIHFCDGAVLTVIVWWLDLNYLFNQCLSPLTLCDRISLRRGVLDTTLCDQVCQWLATGRWFSPGPPVSSTHKTDRHNITEILLKVALSTIKPNQTICVINICSMWSFWVETNLWVVFFIIC